MRLRLWFECGAGRTGAGGRDDCKLALNWNELKRYRNERPSFVLNGCFEITVSLLGTLVYDLFIVHFSWDANEPGDINPHGNYYTLATHKWNVNGMQMRRLYQSAIFTFPCCFMADVVYECAPYTFDGHVSIRYANEARFVCVRGWWSFLAYLITESPCTSIWAHVYCVDCPFFSPLLQINSRIKVKAKLG